MHDAAISAFHLSLRTLDITIGKMGTSVLAVCAGLAYFGIESFGAFRRGGMQAVRKQFMGRLAKGVGFTLLVWMLAFSVILVVEIYDDHNTLKSRAAALSTELKTANQHVVELKKEVVDKTTHIYTTEPIFSNIIYLQQAFRSFRGRTIVPGGNMCTVRFTAPQETHDFAFTIAQLSIQGSNCATFGPFDPGINPDEDRRTINGMVPNKVVFHMAKTDSAANQLFNDLFNYLPLQRSYDGVGTNPDEHTVWLQFGSQVNWRVEMFH